VLLVIFCLRILVSLSNHICLLPEEDALEPKHL